MRELFREVCLHLAREVTIAIGDVQGTRTLSEKLDDSPRHILESLLVAHKNARFIEKWLNLNLWETIKHDIAYRAILVELAYLNRDHQLTEPTRLAERFRGLNDASRK